MAPTQIPQMFKRKQSSRCRPLLFHAYEDVLSYIRTYPCMMVLLGYESAIPRKQPILNWNSKPIWSWIDARVWTFFPLHLQAAYTHTHIIHTLHTHIHKPTVECNSGVNSNGVNGVNTLEQPAHQEQLARGSQSELSVGSGDRTSNLLVTIQPTLPPQLSQPVCINMQPMII